MKISVHETYLLAKDKLPNSVSTELVFFNDEESHNRVIRALVAGEGKSKTSFWLTQLGVVRCSNDGNEMIEKALKAVDKK